jgi:hypothetical protein
MNNPPAFPIQGFSTRYGQGFQAVMSDGMSLRDYLAARAMQALIDNDGLFSEIPTQAYALADAMLKAREA